MIYIKNHKKSKEGVKDEEEQAKAAAEGNAFKTGYTILDYLTANGFDVDTSAGDKRVLVTGHFDDFRGYPQCLWIFVFSLFVPCFTAIVNGFAASGQAALTLFYKWS